MIFYGTRNTILIFSKIEKIWYALTNVPDNYSSGKRTKAEGFMEVGISDGMVQVFYQNNN
jgi:hypothetical protein